MPDEHGPDDLSHEELLEALVTRLLRRATLHQLCDDAGLPSLVDADGTPVTLAANPYRRAGVRTLDRGVYLELSDGSVFGLTVTVSRRPVIQVSLRR